METRLCPLISFSYFLVNTNNNNNNTIEIIKLKFFEIFSPRQLKLSEVTSDRTFSYRFKISRKIFKTSVTVSQV